MDAEDEDQDCCLEVPPDFIATWKSYPTYSSEPMSADHLDMHSIVRERIRRRRSRVGDGSQARHPYPQVNISVSAETFIEAALANDVENLKQMLMAGVSPNLVDDKHRTALHIAAVRGSTEMVSLLLKYGADPDVRDKIGNTPFNLADVSNRFEVMKLLIDVDCWMDVRGRAVVNAAGFTQHRIQRHGRNRRRHQPMPVPDNMCQILDLQCVVEERLKRDFKSYDSGARLLFEEKRTSEALSGFSALSVSGEKTGAGSNGGSSENISQRNPRPSAAYTIASYFYS